MSSGTLSLGHVGLYVVDLRRAKQFYCEVIGLQISDEVERQGLAFLSGDVNREHHELLLCKSSQLDPDRAGEKSPLQQVSFRCNSLRDLQEKYRRLLAANTKIEMVVSHGTAVGVYGFDPEGNRFEVYWDTGVWAKQPFMQDIDLTLESETLESAIKDFARAHSAEGYVDERYLSEGYLEIESERSIEGVGSTK